MVAGKQCGIPWTEETLGIAIKSHRAASVAMSISAHPD
jgi:hypothetical protein